MQPLMSDAHLVVAWVSRRLSSFQWLETRCDSSSGVLARVSHRLPHASSSCPKMKTSTCFVTDGLPSRAFTQDLSLYLFVRSLQDRISTSTQLYRRKTPPSHVNKTMRVPPVNNPSGKASNMGISIAPWT